MNKPKVLILPNDPLKAYDHKGYSKEERSSYFNPDCAFDISIIEIPYYESSFNAEPGQRYDYAGFPVFTLDKNFRGLNELLRIINPQIVRAYGNNSAEVCSYIGRKLNIPSITSVHDLYPNSAIAKVDQVWCVSDAVKKASVEIGVNPSKIRILPNRVDLDVFSDKGSTGLEQYCGKYKIMSAGRLTWEKNLERLVEASRHVQRELGDVIHLHIGDTGEQKERIIEKIGEVGADHIQILPNMTQIQLARFYSWADIFAMASLSEGFGLVYIEALACGTPVVTSNIPPMNSYVKHEHNGLVANPKETESIAREMMRALTDQSLRRKLELNARESVKGFDTREIQSLEAKLYKKVLN